jgi:DNA polymerase-3 subunit delta'
MELAEAIRLIGRALDANAAANGYLVAGDVDGGCRELVARVLERLFPSGDERRQALAGTHPDVVWLEPAGLSRTIRTADVSERFVDAMSVSSYSGGWKVGIVVSADRMQPEAANSFLKLLEEPPPRTLFFLLTGQPDAVLPTIVSRTQRIDLSAGEDALAGEEAARVRALLGRGADGVFERQTLGASLAALLSDVKDAVEDDARVAAARRRFFGTVMACVRDWMVTEALPRDRAFANVEAVEDAYRQSEKSMPDEAVLCLLTERLSFPVPAGS